MSGMEINDDFSIEKPFFSFDPALNEKVEVQKMSLLPANNFSTVQELVKERMQRLAETSEKKITRFDETARKKALQQFLHLHKNFIPLPIYELCQSLIKEGDEKLRKIEATASHPAMIAAQKEQTLTETQTAIEKYVAAMIAAQKEQVLAETQTVIGKCLALTDQVPAKALETAAAVNQEFDAQVEALLARLQAYQQAHQKAGVQNSILAGSLRLPVELAQMLLTSAGQINTAIIAPLRKALFPAGKPLDQYQQTIQRVLTQIDSSWQLLFDAICKPNDLSSIANDLIRADLGLSQSVLLQDLHAKQAALAALLSQHCQGPVGDCFAVAFSVRMHHEFLIETLRQYGELIEFGSLQRLVNGTMDRFFFKKTIADNDLQAAVVIDSKGHLNGGNYLWACPSFQGAFRLMGIDDAQKLASAALKILMGRTSYSTLQTTPQEIIKAFAQASVSANSSLNLTQQIENGLYGFSCTNNRVLRAFETAVASMAESRRGDYVRDNVINSVRTTLQKTWAQCSKKDSALIMRMQNLFDQTLNNQIRFLYNAAIPCVDVSSDGSSTAGGFELYQRDLTNLLNPGVQIATPQQFQQLILRVVDLTVAAMAPLTSQNQKTVLAMAKTIKNFVQTTQFMKNVLIAYEPSNANHFDPVNNYLQLQRTPMTSQNGDNPWEVEAIDLGLSFNPNIQSVRPKNSQELLKWVLDLAVWKESTQHYLEDELPNDLDPATSPQHAFNLALENPDIVSFLESKKSSTQWISDRFAQSKQQVADWMIDKQTKQAFIQSLSLQLPSQIINRFQRWATLLIGQPINLSQFATAMYNELNMLLSSDGSEVNQVGSIVDQVLLQTLPFSILQQIEQSSVRIAQTNWNDGVKNIYFCIYSDPRTGQLAFGTINEDKTGLFPMDESEWVDNQKWDTDVSGDDLPKASGS